MPQDAKRVRIWEVTVASSEQTWTEVDLISYPTKLRGWLFRAKPAKNAICLAYESSQGESAYRSISTVPKPRNNAPGPRDDFLKLLQTNIPFGMPSMVQQKR